MKGIHRIIVQNKRLRYDFVVRRNLTVIRGDSATGKTTLIDMIQEFIDNGNASNIELSSDKKCFVLQGATWKGQLTEIRDSIVFIDEGNSFVLSDEFAEVIRNTDNYYVIVTREGLPNLPYSVEEIYGIRLSGRYGGLKQQYNEFYRIYGEDSPGQDIRPDIVITEDSNSGYQFFAGASGSDGPVTVSAEGKSNLLKKSKQYGDKECVLLIADGAAFGPEMGQVMEYMKDHPNIRLYVPESFEWLILSSGVLKDAEVQDILSAPAAHIESKDYFSWEQYFTSLLTEKSKGTYLQYTKSRINPAYLAGTVKEAILSRMDRISFMAKASSGEDEA